MKTRAFWRSMELRIPALRRRNSRGKHKIVVMVDFVTQKRKEELFKLSFHYNFRSIINLRFHLLMAGFMKEAQIQTTVML
mmetsp:Transcript_12744/g.16752  ORF Transcript_12744/g.16752 Transcript_12744/m.16752 type:complete len:80 (+) Transcript_12744:536-775(+)